MICLLFQSMLAHKNVIVRIKAGIIIQKIL